MRETFGPDGTAQEPTAIEWACDRFKAAWRAGVRPQVEDALAAARPSAASLLRELLLIDHSYRLRAGARPAPEGCLDRFPDDGEGVRAAIAPAVTPDASRLTRRVGFLVRFGPHAFHPSGTQKDSSRSLTGPLNVDRASGSVQTIARHARGPCVAPRPSGSTQFPQGFGPSSTT
jgi:hypothetical protein